MRCSLILQVSEGIDEVAAVCALQRAANNIGAAREYIDREIFRRIFKEPAAFRDLLLLRETLTSDEIAAILAARGNVFLKKKGIALEDLDYSAVSNRFFWCYVISTIIRSFHNSLGHFTSNFL